MEPEQAKTDEGRILPLPAPLKMLLKEITPKTGLVFSTTNCRKEWIKACAAAGLGTLLAVAGKRYAHYSGLTIHDLRRSAIRNLIRAGVHQHVAMKISGHRTSSVFMRYNIIDARDVTDAMHAVEVLAAKNGRLLQGKV